MECFYSWAIEHLWESQNKKNERFSFIPLVDGLMMARRNYSLKFFFLHWCIYNFFYLSETSTLVVWIHKSCINFQSNTFDKVLVLFMNGVWCGLQNDIDKFLTIELIFKISVFTLNGEYRLRSLFRSIILYDSMTFYSVLFMKII